MAEEREEFQRTEEPTPKRREEARRRGQVARSRTLVAAASLLGGVALLRMLGEELAARVGRSYALSFAAAAGAREMEAAALFGAAGQALGTIVPALLPLLGGMALAGAGAGLVQTGFLWTAAPLRPQLARLSPLAGLKRIFGLHGFVELARALLCLGLLAALGFFFLHPGRSDFPALAGRDAGALIGSAAASAWRLLAAGAAVLGALGAVEYLFQRWRTERELKMSRQEIRQELREHEGDPLIKARLRSLRQRLARRRMMAEVRKADVVVTNPSEIAVALRYRLGETAAPRVVAKGAGYVAAQIKRRAREHAIPLVENRSLARLLYRMVEVGQEIPENLYRAVAEVLAYVYRLRRERRGA